MTAALDYIEHVIITAEVVRLTPKVLVPYVCFFPRHFLLL